MRFQLSRTLALASIALASGCGAQPAPPPASMVLTGNGALTADDEIDGLDVAKDAAGGLHVAWRERTHVWSGVDRRQRVVYRRGSGEAPAWGPRIVVAEGGGFERPQVVAAGDGVHVLAGGRLHHWWLPAGGTAFRDMGELLRPEDAGAGAFEAVDDAGGLLVVFASSGKGGHAALKSLRWTGVGGETPTTIAALQEFRARPRLLLQGDRWLAFWADNALVEYREPGTKVATIEARADIRTAATADGGGSWDGSGRIVSVPDDVAAVSAGLVDGAPAVFFASHGLFQSRKAADGWAAPLRIAGYKPGALAGSSETSDVAATECRGHAVLAWVDARNRHSDRRWWNPLGGFPWGDSPDWFDNDVLVATSVPSSAQASAALLPRRLTPPASMTSAIAVVEHSGRLLVFRSGRARVRKAPNDAGAPPEVTQLTVPCD